MSSIDPSSFDLDSVRHPVDEVHRSHGFTIRDLSSQFQLTYRALRFYESKGLLSPRHADGRRIYSQDDRERLELLVWGKRMGFSLAEIGEMIAERVKARAAAEAGAAA